MGFVIKYISPQQVYKSQQRTKLLCEFYGFHHPKCTKSVKRNDELYKKFMEQFKIPDDDDDELEFFSEYTNKK